MKESYVEIIYVWIIILIFIAIGKMLFLLQKWDDNTPKS